MSSSLASVRERILGHWQPGAWSLPTPERMNADQLLEELRSVSRVAAWRSTALLAGQLAEACLRSRLVGAGVSRLRVQTFRTFSVVIREARNGGLLQGRIGSEGGGSLRSAINLRNESSHFAFWKTYTPESEATWALLLAALILEDLAFGVGGGTDRDFKTWLEAEAKVLETAALSSTTGAALSATYSASLAAPPGQTGTIRYSLSDVRSSILARWEPATVSFSQDEKAGVTALWTELKLTADHGAWRSLTNLSGQMVESYLKCKLAQAERADRSGIENMTLKPLIRRWKRENVLARPHGRATTGRPVPNCAIRMVAGAGFEPATFGL